MAELRKTAIIGAGSVGTAIAYAAVIQGVTDELVLYDVNGAKAIAEVLDLRHGLQFVAPARVDGGDDLRSCADADVVVITAGAKQDPGQTRLELAAANARLVRRIVPEVLGVAPDAVVLLVTNPVDVVTKVAQDVAGETAGVPHGRVLGSGTVLDTSRLRHTLAGRLGVSVTSVHATIVGEHGDSEIALWSSANVSGVPITDVVGPDGRRIGPDELDTLLDDVRNAAYRIIEGKGATNLAIGLSTSRILAAIGSDEHAVLPVSTRHEVPGVGDVCYSMPSVVGHAGVLATLEVPLDENERAGLDASARAIRSVLDGLD